VYWLNPVGDPGWLSYVTCPEDGTASDAAAIASSLQKSRLCIHHPFVFERPSDVQFYSANAIWFSIRTSVLDSAVRRSPLFHRTTAPKWHADSASGTIAVRNLLSLALKTHLCANDYPEKAGLEPDQPTNINHRHNKSVILEK
jgi:hypothetical protein